MRLSAFCTLAAGSHKKMPRTQNNRGTTDSTNWRLPDEGPGGQGHIRHALALTTQTNSEQTARFKTCHRRAHDHASVKATRDAGGRFLPTLTDAGGAHAQTRRLQGNAATVSPRELERRGS